MFRNTGDERFRNQGLNLADEQWIDPLPNGLTNQTRYWIDDMYMIGSLQVQAYRVTGKVIYLERAAKELDDYLKKLQQPNGLFFHGPDAPFYWGRGNGWVAAALAELLTVLPKGNSYYHSIHTGYVKMMTTLLRYQADDGMWRQLIDYPEAWKETSSSELTEVCVGTGQSQDPQYYLDRGRSTGDFHGQAPMLWFAYSLLADY